MLSTDNGFTDTGCWITKTGMFNSTVCGVPGAATASDFNGDGKTDILVTYQDADSYYPTYSLYISTGKSFVSMPLAMPVSNIDSIRDVNGDGKPDVIPVETSIGSPATRKHVYYFTGTGFKDGGYIDDKIHMAAAPGDFNGDGKGDRIWVDETANNANSLKYHLNKSPVPDFLSTVSNGMGGTTSIVYRPSSDFKNTDLPYAIPVVSSISFDDGFGNILERTYEYADGLYLRDEKEFRGFGWVKQTNPDGTTL
ncbi:MAG: FG-GAP repeat protein [Nitrospirae bacterium]|nr:FG-GAP repeat protein [Nitrospirota bacterium]